jgi:hypothetical protein
MREWDETSADTLDWFGSGLSLDVSFPLFAFLVPLQRIQAEHTAHPRCMLDTDKGYIAVDVMVHMARAIASHWMMKDMGQELTKNEVK